MGCISDYCPVCGRPMLPVAGGRRRLTGPFETRGELVSNVLARLRDGCSVGDVAGLYGVSASTVSRIRHGDRAQTINGYRVPSRRRSGRM